MKHAFKTNGTCSAVINFELDGNVIHNVSFTGGCNGNLKAISALVEGMTVEEYEKRCKGIRCGFRQTSCSDQLAIALRKALDGQ